jgi:hypothetical protein
MTMMLGSTDLESYVSAAPSVSDERKAYLDRVLAEYPSRDKVLNVEFLPWQQLMIEKAEYREIDLSFLKMRNPVKVEEWELPFPRFAAFRRNDGGFANSFLLDLEIITYLGQSEEIITFRYGAQSVLKRFYGFEGELRRTPRTRAHLRQFGSNVAYSKNYHSSAYFNGLIPQKTKEKLSVADQIFWKDSYLVVEIKPEDWNVHRVHADPLLISVDKSGKAYLIDHFDTTPMEERVRREFTL